jgi:WD40 repeat protein
VFKYNFSMPLKINHSFLGHQGAIYALHQMAETSSFLSGGNDGWLVKWQIEQPELGVNLATIPGAILSIYYLPSENICVVGDLNGVIYWLDLNNPNITPKAIAHHKKGVFSILHLDGHLFTAGGDGFFTKWSIRDQIPLESIRLSFKSIRCVEYDYQKDEFALGCSDGAIYWVDNSTFNLKESWSACHLPSVFSLAFHPDKERMISGGRDALLKVWDRKDGQLLQVIPAHRFTINHLILNTEGNLLFTASRDKSIRVWDSANFNLLASLNGLKGQGHQNSVNRLLWFQKQQTLLSASDDRQILSWKGPNL